MNARTRKALEILNAGGRYEYRLERAYHGGEKFRARLYDADGHKVAGFGNQTLIDLKDAAVVARDWSVVRGSTGRESYRAVQS